MVDTDRARFMPAYQDTKQRVAAVEATGPNRTAFPEARRHLRRQLRSGAMDHHTYQRELRAIREAYERVEDEIARLWDAFFRQSFPDGCGAERKDIRAMLDASFSA